MQRLIFLHIPKTGGTSLRHVLEEVYSVERCLLVYEHDFLHDATARARLQERARHADVVSGHVSFGIHHDLGIEPRYVTVVREPVARVMSFFSHQARDSGSEYYDRIAEGMTLLDLLRSEQCHQANNHMVRILSGHSTLEMVDERWVLEQALDNLATHFDEIGTSHRMDQSVARLATTFGWPTIPSVPFLNVDPNPGSLVLDEEVRSAILHYNMLDVELYAHAEGDAEAGAGPEAEIAS